MIKIQNQNSLLMFFADLVVIAQGPEPDPIPNSTVKPCCANGTKSQDRLRKEAAFLLMRDLGGFLSPLRCDA